MFGKKDDKKKDSSDTSAYVENQVKKFLQTGEKEEVKQVPIEKISPNPFQPRKHFNAEGLKELSESIKEKGVLQPLILHRATLSEQGVECELVDGERRLRASRMAGLTHVPSIIRVVSDKDCASFAFIENDQREELNAVDKMNAIASY